MKLVSFRTPNGDKSFGIHTDAGIVDLGKRLGDRFDSIKSLLAANSLAQVRAFESAPADYAEDQVVFLPVIEQPGKIFCVGMNYAEKRKEFNETNNAPTLFIRFPDSQTGHACPIKKPSMSNEFDYEGELAVVIGKDGFRISQQDALGHVAGYSCYMDGSARDWQHTWFTAGKNWPQTGAFGPWLVTADEVGNPQELGIRTYLNGMKVQDDNTGNMIHNIASLIEYISTFSALSAGDVIITGSPGGVGKKRVPPLFLKENDIIEVEIDRLGRLRNYIAPEAIAA
ncbi:MAG: FAA hydrolase family protein [Rhodocyclales bacterium GT-UBC]|nr:MAG: FAA hydrolase family protein [Rhodocyclales bacterium GT-UBC]